MSRTLVMGLVKSKTLGLQIVRQQPLAYVEAPAVCYTPWGLSDGLFRTNLDRAKGEGLLRPKIRFNVKLDDLPYGKLGRYPIAARRVLALCSIPEA